MFFQKLYFSSNLVSLCQFRLIHSIFRSIEFFLKCFNKPLSISIDQNCFSINRNSWIRFFKNSDSTCSNHFFKTFSNFFLSLRLGKAPLRFFVVFLYFSCKESLSLSLYVHCTLSFSFIFCFTSIFFMHWRVIFGLSIFWGFWRYKPYFVKLNIGFLF